MVKVIQETVEGMAQAGIDAVKEGRLTIAVAAIHNITGFRKAAEKHGKLTAEDAAIFDFNIHALEEALGPTN